jgi:arginyl-tRNA synthetase
MHSENPFAEFQLECHIVLKTALEKLFPESKIEILTFEKPLVLKFGQLAFSFCFKLAKQIGEKPIVLANSLVENLDNSKFSLIERVVPAGGGYINFHVNFKKFSDLTLGSIMQLDGEYGFIKNNTPKKIIVEHTSVNPLHPIHIGQARNPMIGDALARMLKFRGHTIFRHYYIDDVGRQTAVIAYGFQKLASPKPKEKPDHFIGKIYTITSCLVEVNRLNKELDQVKELRLKEDIKKIKSELNDWKSVAAELKEKHPVLYEKLCEKIFRDKNPENNVNALNRAYEAGDATAKQIIREVSELCLTGFNETLKKIDVFYDSWDWESDLVWSGKVSEVLKKLQETKYVFASGPVLEFETEKVIQELDLRSSLNLREDYKIPSLTLIRADGTTLYTTRDIAYTLLKFEKAERCINVIGMEQTLAQMQLKIALYALGYKKIADNLVHFAYNLVTLPGYKMSSRRGRYITLDEVVSEAIKRAYKEVSYRSPKLSEEEKNKIANFVGLGAVRYALVEVDPSKPVVFAWDRVVNFEKNSAPYIQYSHARACSILRKAARMPEKPAYHLLNDKKEHELILALSNFPDVFIEATDFLKPNLIADFVNILADKFNKFYDTLPVIKAESKELSDARLALVYATKIVLNNALKLIGIFAPEKM